MDSIGICGRWFKHLWLAPQTTGFLVYSDSDFVNHCLCLQIEFLKDETCKTVCSKSYDPKKTADSALLKELKRAMNLNYYHHWIVGGFVEKCVCELVLLFFISSPWFWQGKRFIV